MDALITLTDKGLYCPPGDFYIDPWRPVPRAVITHAHGDHASSGSDQYYGALDGLALLRHRLAIDSKIEGIPYGKTFTLGKTHVSFHPAGHILGSAQVRIEHNDTVWVASGDYKRSDDPTCKPFEVVPCDTFITEATFGLPIYHWPSGQKVAEQVLTWWQNNREHGRTSVLFCYALGKAQRLLSELAQLTDQTVYIHGAMETLTNLYRDAGVPMLPTERVGEKTKAKAFAGELVLAPPSAFKTPWMRRFYPYSAGFASGWMAVRGGRRRRGYDQGFVMSDHADWPALLQTISDTGAKRVLATHGNTDTLVRFLKGRDIDAAALKTQYHVEEDDD